MSNTLSPLEAVCMLRVEFRDKGRVLDHLHGHVKHPIISSVSYYLFGQQEGFGGCAEEKVPYWIYVELSGEETKMFTHWIEMAVSMGIVQEYRYSALRDHLVRAYDQ